MIQTADTRIEGKPFDLNTTTGATSRFTMPCANMVTASAQLYIRDGTDTAYVLTVIVSNDPAGALFEDHPEAIELNSSVKITPAFSVAAYLHFGVRLKTAAGGATYGDIFLVCSDSLV